MLLEERTLPVTDLRLGMYVCRLDRPWEGTPFPLQGFVIDDAQQISQLRALCHQVTIDVQLSRQTEPRGAPDAAQQRARVAMVEQLTRVSRREYTDTATLSEELPRARAAQEQLIDLTNRVMDDVRNGRRLIAKEIDQAVRPVVESVLRSADAMFWLNSLRQRSGYEYSHALNCTVTAAAFGRHLGFPQILMVKLASGGLLLDLGKAQLPPELLTQSTPLSKEQIALVRRHVEYSMAILADSGNKSPDVEAMVGSHHERVDGSGYPLGLQGAEIPLFGRIAAIIDTFDAMTSDRPYQPGISKHEALQQLYRLRDQLFQSELVEQFIQCIGVYPTGSLVELSSGEIAAVIAQNRTRQLFPKVLVLTDAEKRLLAEFTEVELIQFADARDGVKTLRILRPLEPGAYGIDTAELYL